MNSDSLSPSWHEANQRDLLAALGRVRQALDRHTPPDSAASRDRKGSDVTVVSPARPPAEFPRPFALDQVCKAFELSPFERDVLLMCAGVELDAAFAGRVSEIQKGRPAPTFSLALAALSGAHWSALSPAGALRRWRLVEVGAGEMLTASPLRIDERVLHFLAGVDLLDERLAVLVEAVPAPDELPVSQQALADRLGRWLADKNAVAPKAAALCGENRVARRDVIASAAQAAGLRLFALRAADVPRNPAEREAFNRLWEREAALAGVVLSLDCDDVDGGEIASAVQGLAQSLGSALVLSCRERVPELARPVIRMDLPRTSRGEQRQLWQAALGPLAGKLNGRLEALAAQFDLGPAAIRAASAEVSALAGGVAQELFDGLWQACLRQSRPQMDDLAQYIEPVAGWDDLVLPEAQRQTLLDIAAQVRQRAKVYETWGMAARSPRSLGISVLFAGPSGTGKTLAAEVLAHALQLNLYRIDLSSVVSKYIGETEKNLRRVFDAAEDGGAILLFDEADALFGKRSEVRDSHDRYANIEVSYLLQRMEAYRGLAILTTNLKDSLDPAFLRRIRFVVNFPFPDSTQRADIWRRIFPPNTPTDGLDIARLARLNVAGGNIRNMALNAAFLAADSGEPVRMRHVLRAARSEYAKLEKSLTEAEVAGWV